MSSLFRDLPHFQHYEAPPQPPASKGAGGEGEGQTGEGEAGQVAPSVGLRAQESSGLGGGAATVVKENRSLQRGVETTEL